MLRVQNKQIKIHLSYNRKKRRKKTRKKTSIYVVVANTVVPAHLSHTVEVGTFDELRHARLGSTGG